jgi:hypothetical protein
LELTTLCGSGAPPWAAPMAAAAVAS